MVVVLGRQLSILQHFLPMQSCTFDGLLASLSDVYEEAEDDPLGSHWLRCRSLYRHCRHGVVLLLAN